MNSAAFGSCGRTYDVLLWFVIWGF